MPPMPVLDAMKVHAAIVDGHEALRWARFNRSQHIDAYTGRWYGEKGIGKKLKPRVMNLMAQAIQSWLPVLAFNNPKFVIRARLPGMNVQAKLLTNLINQTHEEQDTSTEVYRQLVVEAMLSPWAVTYTGLRAGSHLTDVNGAFYDPGEPFVLAIDFDDYAIDPFAKRLNGRRWEAHKFRMSKREMLENPIYAEHADKIRSLTAVEEGGTNQGDKGGMEDAPSRGLSSAITDQVELWNVCIYQDGRVYEGVLPTENTGAPMWLRFAEFVGPEDGPYDHLSFYPVPGKICPLPPIASSRDASDYADDIAAKMARGALKSKKLLVYSGQGKSTAEKIVDADDFAAIRSNDPKSAQVIDVNMVLADMMPICEWLGQSWNQSSGNPTLIGGTGKISGTATEADILNARSTTRLQDLQAQVQKIAAKHGRKMAWFFQTDPLADYMVPIPTSDPSAEPMVVPYTPADRTGQPKDFQYAVDGVSMVGVDPNLRSIRLLEALRAVNENIPLAQAGIVNLPGLLRVLGRNLMIENLEEVLNDPEMVQAALIVAQQQQMMEQRAAGADPSAQPTEQAPTTDATALPAPGSGTPQTPQGARQQMRQQPAAAM